MSKNRDQASTIDIFQAGQKIVNFAQNLSGVMVGNIGFLLVINNHF